MKAEYQKVRQRKPFLKPALYYKARTEEERRSAVLKLMKNDWVLCCWRKSSPHNWFLTQKRTKEQISLDPGDFDRAWVRKISNSQEKVIQYWGADSGMPVLTKYVLRKRPFKIKLFRRRGALLVKGWFQREILSAVR